MFAASFDQTIEIYIRQHEIPFLFKIFKIKLQLKIELIIFSRTKFIILFLGKRIGASVNAVAAQLVL